MTEHTDDPYALDKYYCSEKGTRFLEVEGDDALHIITDFGYGFAVSMSDVLEYMKAREAASA